jgi:hypothetical protein
MNPLVLVARESRNVLRSFWRNRSGAFFTILLPVMFLVFFGAINRDATVQVDPRGPQVGYTTFFAPGMLGMAIMAGTFVSLVISLSVMRDDGQLKRLRGTPCRRGRSSPARSSPGWSWSSWRPRWCSAWAGCCSTSACHRRSPPGSRSRWWCCSARPPFGCLVPDQRPAALAGLARRRLPARPHAGRHAAGTDLRPRTRRHLAGRVEAAGLAGRRPAGRPADLPLGTGRLSVGEVATVARPETGSPAGPGRASRRRRSQLRGPGYFKRLGPGVVTGAADDDPSGIGTYSRSLAH